MRLPRASFANAVSIKYTPAEIEERHRIGESKRGGTLPLADFFNQSQIIRTIGGYLDRSESLLRITNNEPKKQ